jgi:hypothetical protein
MCTLRYTPKKQKNVISQISSIDMKCTTLCTLLEKLFIHFLRCLMLYKFCILQKIFSTLLYCAAVPLNDKCPYIKNYQLNLYFEKWNITRNDSND